MEASPALPCALVPAVSFAVARAINLCASFVERKAANMGRGMPIFFPSCPVERVNGGFISTVSNDE